MMRNSSIEKSMQRAINQAPALDFEKLAAIPVIKMTEHDYITRPQANQKSNNYSNSKYVNRNRTFKQVSAGFAGVMVMLVCVTTWFYQFKTPDSIISLDANQSIEIVTNKNRQILSVKALNEEAQVILNDQNFDQADLEDSVNVIISEMIRNGYLDDQKNVIMVSVENQSPEKANNLAVSLDQVIKDSASAQNITTTVLRQSVTSDQDALNLAGQYNVSTGKMNIMQELMAADNTLSMDTLAAMSVTDLLAVSKEKDVDLTNIVQVDDQQPQKDTKDISQEPITTTTTKPVVTQPVTVDNTTVTPTTTMTPENAIVDPAVPEITENESITPAVTETLENGNTSEPDPADKEPTTVDPGNTADKETSSIETPKNVDAVIITNPLKEIEDAIPTEPVEKQ